MNVPPKKPQQMSKSHRKICLPWKDMLIQLKITRDYWIPFGMANIKKEWCWEKLRAGGEGGDREWDGWDASLTEWTWSWANSERQWRTGKPGVLQSMVLQKVRHDLVTEQQQWKRLTTASACNDEEGCNSQTLLVYALQKTDWQFLSESRS